MITDNLLRYQTYLTGDDVTGIYDFTNATPFLDLTKVWRDYRGDEVNVAVYAPVYRTHTDLRANFDRSNIDVYDPLRWWDEQSSDEFLGTQIAGVIAADDNGVGMVGIAPDARIQSIIPSAEFLPSYDLSNVDIAVTPVDFSNGAFTEDQQGFEDLITGRDGLGTIGIALARPLVESILPGQPTVPEGHSNTWYELNTARNVITTAAVTEHGRVAFDALEGPMMLVVAPVHGLGIFTTFDDEVSFFGLDAPGDLGVESSDNLPFLFNQDPEVGLLTEFEDVNFSDYTVSDNPRVSAGVLSGVVALMLDANPDLGWRDVQEILAYSARLTDVLPGEETFEPPWVFNGADEWNGGGLHYSARSGFGVVDAFAAVRLAETWEGGATSANEASTDSSFVGSTPRGSIFLDDRSSGNANSVSYRFTADRKIDIEHVEISLDFSVFDDFFGQAALDDLVVEIVSPDGTSAQVITSESVGFVSQPIQIDWTFPARTFWGESSRSGDDPWTITFSNSGVLGLNLTLDDVEIAFYGSANDADDTYIYTPEFRDAYELYDHNPRLTDSSGRNTVNTVAIDEDVEIDLRGGERSFSDGDLVFRLSQAAVIAEAITGDGDDVIMGNERRNTIDAGRGNDEARGGSGADSLYGGNGNDLLIGGAGNDRQQGGNGNDQVSGNDGNDILRGGGGNDRLRGGGNEDQLFGGRGNDTLNGGGADDRIHGDDGRDLLIGGGGMDRLFGGAGSDGLRGGDGADRFVMGAGDGRDTILDFQVNTDVIRLTSADRFADLRISDHQQGTLIRHTNNDSIILVDINPNRVDADFFEFA